MARVFGDFDQEKLNNEYLISRTVPDIEPFLADYARLSKKARMLLDVREDVAYGRTSQEVVDIFPAGDNAPVFIFIHGGYWRMLSHKESAFMAPAMVREGIAVVSVNYTLVGEGASITEIVRQCRAAVSWTFKNARDFGGNPDRLFVGGSSAGGHLTGMTVAGGWHDQFGIPTDIIKGAVPLSGLHDLAPIRLSCINEWTKLDEAEAAQNSPVLHLPSTGCPLVVSYGASETAEFKRQSALLADAWAAKGWHAEIFEHPDRNHFDIVFDLCDPGSLLGSKVFALINNV